MTIDLLHISVTQVPTQDWVRATQQQFAPIVIPPHLAIVPTWHDLPEGIAHTIRLDPGLAFGTGSHPTTQLCLEWLCANQAHLANFDVMDYGCGSGILAIAAARLGAKSVDATDIDPNAVQSTADNAAYNDVELDTGLPEVFMGQHYEVVLANILANPLQVLAPMLCEKVNTHGFLVLSGILVEQVELLTACYAPWIPLTVWQEKDGWPRVHNLVADTLPEPLTPPPSSDRGIGNSIGLAAGGAALATGGTMLANHFLNDASDPIDNKTERVVDNTLGFLREDATDLQSTPNTQIAQAQADEIWSSSASSLAATDTIVGDKVDDVAQWVDHKVVDPVVDTTKDAANWVDDKVIDPVVDTTKDAAQWVENKVDQVVTPDHDPMLDMNWSSSPAAASPSSSVGVSATTLATGAALAAGGVAVADALTPDAPTTEKAKPKIEIKEFNNTDNAAK
ncbi:unnamed protein product, partial [Darwinula stevensoni]